MSNLSRRTLVSTAAALPALAVPAVASTQDPAFEAIAHLDRVSAEAYRLSTELDLAECAAAGAHGQRPIPLVSWRNMYIGGIETDRHKEQLLARGDIDKDKIESEYRVAKSREQELYEAGEEWDAETGLAELRNKHDAAWAAKSSAEKCLTQAYPTTPAGAAAFLRVVIKDMEAGDAPWQNEALETIASALSEMAAA